MGEVRIFLRINMAISIAYRLKIYQAHRSKRKNFREKGKKHKSGARNNHLREELTMAKKEKGPMTPKQQKIRKIFSIIASTIGVIIVVMTLLVSIMTITRTQKEDGVASLFGYAFMPVLTNSMEPTIMTGDLIVTKLYEGDGSDLKVGDIVTFKIYINTEPFYNTHRIYAVNEDGYGSYWYITRGDNNPDENLDGEPDVDYITQSPYDIVAVYTGVHLGGVGQAVTKLQTDATFYFLVVVTPLILLFVIYVFFFVRAVVQMKMKKTREEAIASATAAAIANANMPMPARVSLDELSDDEKLQMLLDLQAKKAAAQAAEAAQAADIAKTPPSESLLENDTSANNVSTVKKTPAKKASTTVKSKVEENTSEFTESTAKKVLAKKAPEKKALDIVSSEDTIVSAESTAKKAPAKKALVKKSPKEISED